MSQARHVKPHSGSRALYKWSSFKWSKNVKAAGLKAAGEHRMRKGRKFAA
eukprot:CAMPEP_0170652660 /NCGR_PEP_ID=MMETSP0224-20130122/47014_1 /TAXON_ID=285029 /ORGANISM="Togula jolla, Strain CCCM 725" /LENGTH=49 /DNA_ID= /DNA_START= /DNA_END= /DNA_ORIENTATION=